MLKNTLLHLFTIECALSLKLAVGAVLLFTNFHCQMSAAEAVQGQEGSDREASMYHFMAALLYTLVVLLEVVLQHCTLFRL